MQPATPLTTQSAPLAIQTRLLAPADITKPEFPADNERFAESICPDKDHWTKNGKTLIEAATAAYLIHQAIADLNMPHRRMMPETGLGRPSAVMIGKWLETQLDHFEADGELYEVYYPSLVVFALSSFLMSPPNDISEETGTYLVSLQDWTDKYVKKICQIQSPIWSCATEALLRNRV